MRAILSKLTHALETISRGFKDNLSNDHHRVHTGFEFRQKSMKVPTTGRECPFFYGDYHRGKQHEECRLIGYSNPPWDIKYCKTCPVPDIVQANGCAHMILSGEIKAKFLNMGQKVKITAYCTKTHQEVDDPYVGCGECHPTLNEFIIRK